MSLCLQKEFDLAFVNLDECFSVWFISDSINSIVSSSWL